MMVLNDDERGNVSCPLNFLWFWDSHSAPFLFFFEPHDHVAPQHPQTGLFATAVFVCSWHLVVITPKGCCILYCSMHQAKVIWSLTVSKTCFDSEVDDICLESVKVKQTSKNKDFCVFAYSIVAFLVQLSDKKWSLIFVFTYICISFHLCGWSFFLLLILFLHIYVIIIWVMLLFLRFFTSECSASCCRSFVFHLNSMSWMHFQHFFFMLSCDVLFVRV